MFQMQNYNKKYDKSINVDSEEEAGNKQENLE
jgi:hypothetical protein